MTQAELFTAIKKRKSYLCVGLDSDLPKIPSFLYKEEDPLFAFNRQIIDATKDYCVAYKINTAFYEALGAKGWLSMEKTLQYIPQDKFTIADAKRGDIGNTVDLYAKAFFEQMSFDAVTVAPYMGQDSVSPFLKYKNKWVILLALTSNPSSSDFQFLNLQSGEKLFEKVIRTSQTWADSSQMMYVLGATQTEMLHKIRELAPQHFLLVPGVGTQGGSLREVSEYGMNKQCGLLVNVSRNILYASEGKDFAEAAGQEAQKIQAEMEIYLHLVGF